VLLAVSQSNGECKVETNEKNTAETVANFMVNMVVKAVEQQITELLFILDNARQHKKKMKALFEQQLQEKDLNTKIKVNFLHTPPYSPSMNAAEYNIQIIRKKHLKHLPHQMTIDQRVKHLIKKVDTVSVMDQQQMQNVVQRIKRVPFL